MVDQLLSQTTTTSPIMILPFLRHIFPEASGLDTILIEESLIEYLTYLIYFRWNNMLRIMENVSGFVGKTVNSHLENYEKNQDLKGNHCFLLPLFVGPMGRRRHYFITKHFFLRKKIVQFSNVRWKSKSMKKNI